MPNHNNALALALRRERREITIDAMPITIRITPMSASSSSP
jgi:hypothetical protein